MKAGGAVGAGAPIALLSILARVLGIRGMLVLAGIAGLAYLFAPASVKHLLGGLLSGGDSTAQGSEPAAAPAPPRPPTTRPATSPGWCWRRPKTSGRPNSSKGDAARLDARSGARIAPDAGGVFRQRRTGGCGNASSAVGPFYCPADQKLYIDPRFYEVMEQRLRAPGDFAQAYVIAHEVGHHVQNLIGIDAASEAARRRPQPAVGPAGAAGRLLRRRLGTHRARRAGSTTRTSRRR